MVVCQSGLLNSSEVELFPRRTANAQGIQPSLQGTMRTEVSGLFMETVNMPALH